MNGKFWAMLVDFKIAERYYWYYICDSKKWDSAISAICLLSSAACISAWYIWKQFPLLWAILIAAAQVVGVLKPLFPFSERLTASRYIYQDLGKLVIEIEKVWGFDGSGIADSKLRSLLSEFECRYADIEHRFSTPDLFPQKLKLHAKAQEDAAIYFKNRYHTEEGG